ncbi:MAG: hypothetical protein Q9163_000507 [Psora crenata]
MQWTAAEEALLLRMRQDHPNANWKSVAQCYNAEVQVDRQRSHWSLIWKHRRLIESNGQSQTDDYESHPPSHSGSLTENQHQPLPTNVLRQTLPTPNPDLSRISMDSPSDLCVQQEITQRRRKQDINAANPRYCAPGHVMRGYNGIQSDNVSPTSLRRLLPKPRSNAPSQQSNNESSAASYSQGSSSKSLTRNLGSNRQAGVVSQRAEQLASYDHPSEHGPGWHEGNDLGKCLDYPCHHVNSAGPFMGYPGAS